MVGKQDHDNSVQLHSEPAPQLARQQRTDTEEPEGIKMILYKKKKCSILEQQGIEVGSMLADKGNRHRCRYKAGLKKGGEK